MPTWPPSPHHPRAGLTLVEVLVAILILTAGALSSVGTQVAIARLTRATLIHQKNAADASALLDSLRATPCAALTGGSLPRSHAQLTWTAIPNGDLVELRLTVLPSVGATWQAETLLPCA